MRIAIMQGRLLPPVDGRIQAFPAGRWAEEFPLAAAAGLAAIEWIYEASGAETNPLATDAGLAGLLATAAAHDIELQSICADWFMDRPFLRASEAERAERIGHLRWLLGRAARAEVRHVVLPFVDVSAMRSAEEEDAVVALLSEVLPSAESAGVELHVESDLPPERFAALLARVSHPLIRANYDSGNSASLGFDPRTEFVAYGDRIGSVHLKDRLRGGGTVPLGSGHTDFSAVRSGLHAIGYCGLFTLQVARERPGEECAWVRKNRQWAEAWFA